MGAEIPETAPQDTFVKEHPMADESDLRRMLREQAADAPDARLDPSRLVRRTRARRLPRQLAVGGALSLAIVGLGVGTATGLRLLNPPTEVTAADAGARDEGAEEAAPEASTGSEEGPSTLNGGDTAAGGGISLAPAYKLNLCEGTLGVPSDPADLGLSITIDFPESAPVGDTVRGSVEITNVGDEPIRGLRSDTAATTLSQDGLVLWHTPRVETTVPVDLAPGETASLDAEFEPQICSVQDDGQEDFRADLPPVPAGSYDVSVALDIVQDDGFVRQAVSDSTPISLD
jgi:hypothetical protein